MQACWSFRGVRSGRLARQPRRARLWLEHLETRIVPSDNRIFGPVADSLGGLGEFHPTIVAGDPNGTPDDSPSKRVDPNTTTSPYAGVGSVQVNARRGTYIGTGTPIDATHILTAGHVLDINNDGKATSKDGIKSLYFNLNFGGNLTHKIAVTSITINPNYTGFNRPSVNDDLAILTLATPLPAGVPIYSLPVSDLLPGTPITLVGYGQSGDGINGYTVNASFSVKRTGVNNADAFYGQDDAGQPAANEVFRYDFDGPTGNGTFGLGTLGNDKETTIGGGDSGGPSFVGNVIVGVNTFTQGFTAPRFGSLGGGINVFPYLSWITSATRSATAPASTESDASRGNSGKGKGEQPADATAVIGLSELSGHALRRVIDVSTVANATVRAATIPPVVVVAPTQPAPRLTPATVRTNSPLRTHGYVVTEELVGDGEEGEGVDAGMPRGNPRRQLPPPPAPAPIPAPDSEDMEQARQSSWLHDGPAVFWDAGDGESGDDTVSLASESAELPAPILNSGAVLAGLALFLGGISARTASPNDPRRKRDGWLR